jgi:cell wall-associated NlpC family hydrolase
MSRAARALVVGTLGLGVIGSVYGELAYRRTPSPVRAVLATALSLALVSGSFSAPATVSAASPGNAVVAAAREYLGSPYRLGSEGPATFDCSGLLFRVFSDIGELPRIGGMRLRARGYKQYFLSRGRVSKDVDDARPGDLIVWNDGEHIGIYVGDDKVISALANPWGVSVHSLHAIDQKLTQILLVDWGSDDDDRGGKGNNDRGGNGDEKGSGRDEPPGRGPDPDERPDSDGDIRPDADGQPDAWNAVAIGTMNMRLVADPNARIVGWIGRGGSFKIVAEGRSPGGHVWYEITTRSGKHGWVYSRWVRQL